MKIAKRRSATHNKKVPVLFFLNFFIFFFKFKMLMNVQQGKTIVIQMQYVQTLLEVLHVLVTVGTLVMV